MASVEDSFNREESPMEEFQRYSKRVACFVDEQFSEHEEMWAFVDIEGRRYLVFTCYLGESSD